MSQIAPETVLPHSIEAEEAILGAALIDPAVIPDLIPIVREDTFYLIRHRYIWAAILSLYHRHLPVDPLTVEAELRQAERLEDVGGMAYLLRLVSKTPSALNAAGYAQLAEQLAVRRRLIDAAGEIVRLAHSDSTPLADVIAAAAQRIAEAGEHCGNVASHARSVAQQLTDMILKAEAGQGTIYLPTQWPLLDELTDYQIQMGVLVYIVGAPAHGKSTLACQLAARWALAARRGDIPAKWVLYVTIEMRPHRALNRMAAALSLASANLMLRGTLAGTNGTGRRDEYFAALSDLATCPLYFVGERVGVMEISNEAERLAQKHRGRGIVIVDTVNKLRGVLGSRVGEYEGLSGVSSALDALKQRGDLIIGLLQHRLEREYTTDYRRLRPSLNTIKGSGHTVADADVILSIYRADCYRRLYGPKFDDPTCPAGMALIDVLKLRDGDATRNPILMDWLSASPALGKAYRITKEDIDAALG